MRISIFGATGELGSECLQQALEAGFEVSVLARNPSKIPNDLARRITVIEGDGLNQADVSRTISTETDAVLFAVGLDRKSPKNLCTDITRNIVSDMKEKNLRRLIWCGGGSNLMVDDQVTLGSRFVAKYAQVFMSRKHNDKEHQYALLGEYPEIDWIGLRPLQMLEGSKTGQYRVGFDRFSGISSISFADCAHAMLSMVQDDTWIRKAPIIQY